MFLKDYKDVVLFHTKAEFLKSINILSSFNLEPVTVATAFRKMNSLTGFLPILQAHIISTLQRPNFDKERNAI